MPWLDATHGNLKTQTDFKKKSPFLYISKTEGRQGTRQLQQSLLFRQEQGESHSSHGRTTTLKTHRADAVRPIILGTGDLSWWALLWSCEHLSSSLFVKALIPLLCALLFQGISQHLREALKKGLSLLAELHSQAAPYPKKFGGPWLFNFIHQSQLFGGLLWWLKTVKHLPAVWETWVQSLGWEDSLEKEMATHSSTLAWKIPWTEEPGGLQSMGSQSQTRLSNFTSYSVFGSTTLSKTCF